jgi:hypothetical protein
VEPVEPVEPPVVFNERAVDATAVQVVGRARSSARSSRGAMGAAVGWELRAMGPPAAASN